MRKITVLFATILVLTLHAQSITYDFEISWSEQFSGVAGSLNCVTSNITSGSNAVVWTCGNYGIVLRSTNDGVTWANVGPNGIPGNINLTTISIFGGNIAVTAGYYGETAYVYRTENGGLNWTQVFTQHSGFINGIYLNYYGKAIMLGNPVNGRWSIWKSTNLGITWDSANVYLPQNNTETGFSNAFYVQTYGDKLWFGTNNSRIYFSSNAGYNWSIQNVPEQNIYSINWFGMYEIAGGNNMFISSDNGSSWNQVETLGSGILNAITVPEIIIILPEDNLPSMPWLYLRNDKNIYYTDKGSTGWEVKYTAYSGTYNHITSDSKTIWAVRNNGGITRGTIDVITSIDPINYPYSFELMQNYPNPFNPKTVIPLMIYKPTAITLNLYNSAGKLVWYFYKDFRNLMTFDIISPPYQIEWDGTEYPSGIYYYQVISDDYTETRKMTLLK